MNTGSSRFLVAVALGAGAYYVATLFVLPWFALLLPSLRGMPPIGVYAALHLANVLVLVALSVPFAFALTSSKAALTKPVAAAASIALLGLALPSVIQAGAPGLAFAASPVSVALDLSAFILVLPALTWVRAKRLPANNSSKPTPLRGAA